MQLHKFNLQMLSQLVVVIIVAILFDPLGSLSQTQELKQTAQSTRKEAEGQLNLCREHLKKKQFKPAIQSCQQAQSTFRAIEDRLGEAKSTFNLGIAYKIAGQYDQAQAAMLIGLELAKEVGDQKIGAIAYHNLGDVFEIQGQYSKAIDFHQQSLAIVRDIGDRRGEAISLNNLGSNYSSLGQYPKAIDFYQQSLAIVRDIGDRDGEGLALSNIGDALNKLGDTDLAITFFKQSVNVREGIRADIQELSRDLQKSYTQTVVGTYRQLADLLIERGRIAEAQQVLELLKLQELNDFTRGTRSPDQLSKIDLNPVEKQIKTEHGTLIAFGRKFYDCEQSKCKDLETLKSQYKALDKAFFELAKEITRKAQENRRQQIEEGTLSFQDSADRVVTAHPNSVIIYPLVLPNKVRLLWAAKGGVIDDVLCDLTEEQLNRTTEQLLRFLKTPKSDPDQIKIVGKQLYDCLVKPLEPELQANGIQHLIFVPDRIIHSIPMGVLHDGKQFLIQRFRINSVLNAGLTDTEARLPTTTEEISGLGLGLSEAIAGFVPLQHVLTEVDTLVKTSSDDPHGIYPGFSFLNRDFNLAALKNNVQGRQIVHIATHGEFVPTNPYDSYLLLGTGEKYPIPDIQTLRQLQGVHLVVLSACETASSGRDHTIGIEVPGISSYFIRDRDKAKAVLASLWKVNDASTSQLMKLFYQKLATEKLSKTEALRQAQMELITGQASGEGKERASVGTVSTRTGLPPDTQQNWEHPYYWAPFILIGNGL